MLETRKSDKGIVVYLKGRLDVHLSAEVEKQLIALIEKEAPRVMIINLANVEYMSSSGLRVLVATMRALKKNEKSLRLSNLNLSVKKVFEVVELMDMFDIYESEDEALNA